VLKKLERKDIPAWLLCDEGGVGAEIVSSATVFRQIGITTFSEWTRKRERIILI
jgi:hypothetical protein